MRKIIRVERIKPIPYKRKNPLWLVGFTDLTTLLLAYFILLYSMSQPREAPWQAASESLRMRFSGEESMTPVMGNPGNQDAKKTWQSADSAPGLDLHYLYSLLQGQIAKRPALKDVVLIQEARTITISLPAAITFRPADDYLSAQGETIVQQLAPILMRLPNTVMIVGHADANMVNSDGRFGSNWHLSLARANAVADALKMAGYRQNLEVIGRGTLDSEMLPKNLPEQVRNELARRVDLRLGVVEP
jgi:chemotaxis protein MotB